MAHYAKVENGVVTNVIVADSDHILTLSGKWIQTSYNTYNNEHILGGTPLRYNFAAIGCTYDSDNDAFYGIKPHSKWIIDSSTFTYVAPVDRPGGTVKWNDSAGTWDSDTSLGY